MGNEFKCLFIVKCQHTIDFIIQKSFSASTTKAVLVAKQNGKYNWKSFSYIYWTDSMYLAFDLCASERAS